jgi:hypothetical protein
MLTKSSTWGARQKFLPHIVCPQGFGLGRGGPKRKTNGESKYIRDEIQGEIKELVDEMGKENTTIVQQYMLSYISSKEPYLRY